MPNPRQALFDAHFADGVSALSRFVKTHGHAVVPGWYRDPEGFSLYNWLRVQRQHMVNGRLSAGRLAELRGLGVTGGVLDDMYLERIAMLREIKAIRGSADIPAKFEYGGIDMGEWLAQAKHRARMGTVKQMWVDELKALGVKIERRPPGTPRPAVRATGDQRFDAGIGELSSFKAANGHVHVPQTFVTAAGFRLGSWLHAHRRSWRDGTLGEGRVARFTALGVSRRIDRDGRRMAKVVFDCGTTGA